MSTSDLTPDTTMGDLLARLPGARRALFAKYHLGGCQSCAYANTETLAELATRAEVDPDEMLEHLLESHRHDMEWLIEPSLAAAQFEEFRVIDLRTREEHESVVIPRSEFFTQELQQQIFAGDPQTRLLLYDHSGRSVLDQVAWFRGHGLVQTYGLRGGINAWSLEVDPKIPRYRIEFDEAETFPGEGSARG